MNNNESIEYLLVTPIGASELTEYNAPCKLYDKDGELVLIKKLKEEVGTQAFGTIEVLNTVDAKLRLIKALVAIHKEGIIDQHGLKECKELADSFPGVLGTFKREKAIVIKNKLKQELPDLELKLINHNINV